MSYVIDTDPGADDALALAFAWQALMPVSAITVVYGNATLEDCVRNALMLRASFGRRDIPVYEGESKPLMLPARLSEAHGGTGVGTFGVDLSAADAVAGDATAHFSSLVSPVTLLCLGPLTNVARAIEAGAAKNIREIIFLGGVFWEKGNVSPYAEFNVYNDPNALDVVLRSGIRLTIVPADACRTVTVSKEEVDAAVSNDAARERLHAISDVFIEYYQHDAAYGGFSGGVMYDVLVVGFALHPELFRTEQCRVTVDCSDGEMRGRTSIADGGYPCHIVKSVDAPGLKRRFFEAMNAR